MLLRRRITKITLAKRYMRVRCLKVIKVYDGIIVGDNLNRFIGFMYSN